jgi:membrane protease YdiL (CAAX protease family)
LLPTTLTLFAPVAALVGATEEVVYRGYMQGRLRALGPLPAVALAALGHTAYKCALFALPGRLVGIDFGILAACTFLGGLLFGALRERAGSVLPPLVAHACFDILVYGELAHAPWWVWA